MLNEKSKIKVVYTVWSYSYPELSEPDNWAFKFMHLKACQMILLGRSTSISNTTRPWMNSTFFFLHSQICFFFHPLLSDNGITIHPATAAKILSLSHSWSPMLNQWLYPAMHLAKISQFYPLLHASTTALKTLSEFYLHHFRYLVICFLVITITCSSLHASYLIIHTEPGSSPRTVLFPTSKFLCSVLSFFLFPIYPFPSFLPDYSCFKTQLEMSSLLKSFLIFSIVSAPTPTAKFGPRPLPSTFHVFWTPQMHICQIILQWFVSHWHCHSELYELWGRKIFQGLYMWSPHNIHSYFFLTDFCQIELLPLTRIMRRKAHFVSILKKHFPVYFHPN